MPTYRYTRTPLGRLQPGDEIYALGRNRRHGERLGVVKSAVKVPKHRHVEVHYADGGGFTQNWAAHVYVKHEVVLTRCPGCAVVVTPHSEHLDNCPYQGRNSLSYPEAAIS